MPSLPVTFSVTHSKRGHQCHLLPPSLLAAVVSPKCSQDSQCSICACCLSLFRSTRLSSASAGPPPSTHWQPCSSLFNTCLLGHTDSARDVQMCMRGWGSREEILRKTLLPQVFLSLFNFKSFLSFRVFFNIVCAHASVWACVSVCVYHCTCEEDREQFAGVGSLLLYFQCGSQMELRSSGFVTTLSSTELFLSTGLVLPSTLSRWMSWRRQNLSSGMHMVVSSRWKAPNKYSLRDSHPTFQLHLLLLDLASTSGQKGKWFQKYVTASLVPNWNYTFPSNLQQLDWLPEGTICRTWEVELPLQSVHASVNLLCMWNLYLCPPCWTLVSFVNSQEYTQHTGHQSCHLLSFRPFCISITASAKSFEV